MAKHLTYSLDAALRSTADAILVRARAIKAPPAKDKALELARFILREASHFGGAELQDQDIRAALEAEGIGVATFKKALSTARKELVKKPKTRVGKGAAKGVGSPSPAVASTPAAAQSLGTSSIVPNISRESL